MTLTVGSLFSGIGGLELGLEMAGPFKTAWQAERDPFARSVLDQHWPGVPRFEDVRNVTAQSVPRVDLICGGFPCQPHSTAGHRLASADDRDLWGEFARIIGEIAPRWVVAENVRGLLSSADPARGRGRGGFFGRVLRDLARFGFHAEWHSFQAASVGAPHLRDRVFLLAYATGAGAWGERPGADLAYSEQQRLEGRGEPLNRSAVELAGHESPGSRATVGRLPTWAGGTWEQPWPLVGTTESGAVGLADGLPGRVDQVRCYGNAVVPQVGAVIGRAILDAERHRGQTGHMPPQIVTADHLMGAA